MKRWKWAETNFLPVLKLPLFYFQLPYIYSDYIHFVLLLNFLHLYSCKKYPLEDRNTLLPAPIGYGHYKWHNQN